jgi:hypothetical protein
MDKLTLDEQAQEILKIAEKHGVEQNFFFITTFQRYMRHLKNLKELESILDKEGISVERTYVKGASNRYIHPALAAYNKTSAEASKTVSILVGIILKLRDKGAEDDEDHLLDFLSGKKQVPK